MTDPVVKTKPARSAPPRLGRGLGKTLVFLAEKSGAMDPALIAAWSDIVGPELASICRPVRLIRQGKSQTLVVSVTSGAAAMRVQYAQTQILQRAAHFLRAPTLKKLSIEQKGVPNAAGRGRKAAPTKRFASRVLTAADLPQAAPAPPEPPAKSVAEALERLRQSLKNTPR